MKKTFKSQAELQKFLASRTLVNPVVKGLTVTFDEEIKPEKEEDKGVAKAVEKDSKKK